jgi:hypothetical protein
MAKAEMKNYTLREKNGKEDAVFTGKQPRQAALKAANRSKGTKSKPVEIRLRERGTKKVHILKGGKKSPRLRRINLLGCLIRSISLM